MAMPSDIGIIDTCMSFPVEDRVAMYKDVNAGVKDPEAKTYQHVAQYMFKDRPRNLEPGEDPVQFSLSAMDQYGVQVGLVLDDEVGLRACREYPDRFVGLCKVDPNDVMGSVRKVDESAKNQAIKGVYVFPAGSLPQVPINDKKMYPLYAKCVEYGLPFFANAGVPGPRVRSDCQYVGLIEEVMFDFPELTFVMRHGAEPWEDLAVKLMIKWPGLHYSTSAFAPKHYPKAIIDYANTRGTDKIIYAGHFPSGLTMERIFEDLPNVPFRDKVWPKFLRENALRVLKIDENA